MKELLASVVVEEVHATTVVRQDTWYVLFSFLLVGTVLMIVARLYRGPCPRLLPRRMP